MNNFLTVLKPNLSTEEATVVRLAHKHFSPMDELSEEQVKAVFDALPADAVGLTIVRKTANDLGITLSEKQARWLHGETIKRRLRQRGNLLNQLNGNQ